MNTTDGLEEGGEPTRLLSILIFARNDNYFGNFKYRLTTNLNFLARSLRRLGRLEDVEVMLTDWNSETPLSEALELTPDAASICRFVRVPPALAATVQAPGAVMYATCAANVGARRARGRYLMQGDSDTLFPPHMLMSLFNLIEGKIPLPFDVSKALFVLGRYQVPRAVVKRQPSLEQWERFLLMNAFEFSLEHGHTGLGTHGAGQLMHRALWFECRGYDEQLKYGPWMDGELTSRVSQRYPWLNLASLGMAVFHMEHESSALNSKNRYKLRPTFVTNDEHWGLGNHELQIMTATAMAGDGGASWELREAPAIELRPALAHFNQGREELLSELTGQWVRRQVSLIHRHLEVFINSLISDRDDTMRQHLQMDEADLTIVAQALNYEPGELAVIFALAWYTLYHHPKTYLEFGLQRWHTVPVVASVLPNVEIYGVDPWQTGLEKPVPSPYFLTYLLQATKYAGYLRFVPGDCRTAVSRLESSAIFPFTFDLALFRGEMLGEVATAQLLELVPRMTAGAALVFTAPDEDRFQSAWSEARARFPHLTFVRFRDVQTGVILAASLELSGLDSEEGNEIVAGVI